MTLIDMKCVQPKALLRWIQAEGGGSVKISARAIAVHGGEYLANKAVL